MLDFFWFLRYRWVRNKYTESRGHAAARLTNQNKHIPQILPTLVHSLQRRTETILFAMLRALTDTSIKNREKTQHWRLVGSLQFHTSLRNLSSANIKRQWLKAPPPRCIHRALPADRVNQWLGKQSPTGSRAGKVSPVTATWTWEFLSPPPPQLCFIWGHSPAPPAAVPLPGPALPRLRALGVGHSGTLILEQAG